MAAADASKAAGPAVAAASTAPASGSTVAATEEVGVEEIEVAPAGETPARWGMQGTAVEPEREDAEDDASVLAAAAEAMCVANRFQLVASGSESWRSLVPGSPCSTSNPPPRPAAEGVVVRVCGAFNARVDPSNKPNREPGTAQFRLFIDSL